MYLLDLFTMSQITLRLNYIYWLEDLLEMSKRDNQIIGVDIGVGASCIYPLLGSRKNGWYFLGTEVDATSYQHAKSNVTRNHLKHMISLAQVPPGHESILCGMVDGDDALAFARRVRASDDSHLDFCMCNPPFFGGSDEIVHNPRTSMCDASVSETVYTGGEVAFLSRMLTESTTLLDKVTWYTSMLGKHSSVIKVIEILDEMRKHDYQRDDDEYHIADVQTTAFFQGKTTRWGVAWRYDKGVNPGAGDGDASVIDAKHTMYEGDGDGGDDINLRQWLQEHAEYGNVASVLDTKGTVFLLNCTSSIYTLVCDEIMTIARHTRYTSHDTLHALINVINTRCDRSYSFPGVTGQGERSCTSCGGVCGYRELSMEYSARLKGSSTVGLPRAVLSGPELLVSLITTPATSNELGGVLSFSVFYADNDMFVVYNSGSHIRFRQLCVYVLMMYIKYS